MMLPMNKSLSFSGADLIDWSGDRVDACLAAVRAEYAVSLPGTGFSIWIKPNYGIGYSPFAQGGPFCPVAVFVKLYNAVIGIMWPSGELHITGKSYNPS